MHFIWIEWVQKESSNKVLSGSISGRINLFGLVMYKKIWKHLEYFGLKRERLSCILCDWKLTDPPLCRARKIIRLQVDSGNRSLL